MARRLLPALLAVLTIALVAVAAGCGGGDGGGSGDDPNALVVYSGRSEELIGPLYERFEQETGIDLDVRYGDSTDLALLIGEEGDRSPADVFSAQSPGAVAYLQGRGLLAPIPAGVIAKVPANLRSPDRTWVGVTGRQRVLVYNPDLVSADQLPASVFDLTRPEYKDKVGLAPSNASFQDFVTAMRQTRGEAAAKDWLEGMAANGARSYGRNTAILEAVERGEVPMGLVNHYYVAERLAEEPGAKVAVHRFAGEDIGNLFLTSTVSVLKASDRKAQADRFVAFLLTPASQRFFAETTKEYPVLPGVPAGAGVAPIQTLTIPAVAIGELTDLEATARLINESGIGD